MSVKNTITFVGALIRTNLKAAVALRSAFLLQSIFMILSNTIFFTIWWIFFRNFQEIRGWRLSDVAALHGLVNCSFGCTIIFGGGIYNLARMISDGSLDSFMTQPKNLLLHIIGSRSDASGWGDIVTGFMFLYFSGFVHLNNVHLILLLVLCSTVIFISSSVLINSLAFWVKSMEGLAKQLFEYIINLSTYPATLFNGFLKFLLFTIIPSGFIGYLPVEILRKFTWLSVLIEITSAILYVGIANLVFNIGLKKYESGNQFGIRG